MRLLLDTHTFLWWIMMPERLPQSVRTAIADPDIEVLISAVSAFEITTKWRIGKLPVVEPLVHDVEAAFLGEGFAPLPVTIAHAERAGRLPGPHRDPFDRLLIAQALALDMPIATSDAVFNRYNCQVLW